jgi:SpoVK/Ycf46/Vps4 family AAA+-type ATPase
VEERVQETGGEDNNLISPDVWERHNQQYLVACIGQVKALLKSHIERDYKGNVLPLQKPLWEEEEEADTAIKPAIEYVCETFGLSGFERLILILCAGVELDSEVSELCAKAQGSPSATYPIFSLALAAFPEAHWSALAPTSPLRRFRLIYLQGIPHVPITRCQLQIDERVLHYLAGVSYIDKSLQGTMQPVCVEALISESQKVVASAIIHAWKSGRNPFHIQLAGPDEVSKRVISSWVCRHLGIMLWQIHGELVPLHQEEQEAMAQIWTRESALMNAGLYIAASDTEPATQKAIKRFMNNTAGPIFLSTNEPWRNNNDITAAASSMLSFDISKPTKLEQRSLWKLLLEKALPADSTLQIEDEIVKVVNQFNLNALAIQSVASEVILAMSRGEKNLHDALWSASLEMARPRLSELVQRIKPKQSMDDLVLPEKEKQVLRSIIANVKQRYRVYEEWGFGVTQRGLGIAALFSGDSGTGKTMAAEVMARELELDLFKIDLSMVVNKYIGETEKNLRKIFDAAEDGGAILLFDEADALFGKRSEVRDSHDRYANMEVSYLLQRMEAYRGVAILTTNMKDALDKAFLRRIRFVVNFPFPNEKSRKEIWRRVFPKPVPLDKEIEFDRLAQLEITGGHIRNIALGASVIAAEEDSYVGMAHIISAAKEEYNKMERPMPRIWCGQ